MEVGDSLTITWFTSGHHYFLVSIANDSNQSEIGLQICRLYSSKFDRSDREDMLNSIDPIDLKTRVAKTVLVASTILFAIIIINDSLIGLIKPALIKLPVILVFIWAYRLLDRIGFKPEYTHLVNIPVLFFFTFNYFTNQGTDGPTLLGMTSMFVVYPILLSNRWKWIYTTVTLLLIGILLYVGTDKANLINPVYHSSEEQFFDHFASAMAMGIYLTIIVSIVINLYRRQNQNLSATQATLTSQLKVIETEKERNQLLLGIIAHDVKGPVNNLKQLLELRDQLNNSPELINKLFNDVGKRLSDVGSTIDNVLEKTKIDLAQGSKTTVNPIKLTQSLLDDSAYKFEAKQQVTRLTSTDAAKAQASLGAITAEVNMVLRNLIDNAHKYAPENSVITIELDVVQGRAHWQITNEGPAIPKELQSRLFSKSVTSKEGTGVGLYLCKSIADQIGAELYFTTGDSGTTFHFKVGV